MRKNPTKAEAALWQMIRNKKCGARFRRQKIILGWIADFYSPELRIVIEVDGGYHEDRSEIDRIRDESMRRIGIKTIRITNEDVLLRPESVVRMIRGLDGPYRPSCGVDPGTRDLV